MLQTLRWSISGEVYTIKLKDGKKKNMEISQKTRTKMQQPTIAKEDNQIAIYFTFVWVKLVYKGVTFSKSIIGHYLWVIFFLYLAKKQAFRFIHPFKKQTNKE